MDRRNRAEQDLMEQYAAGQLTRRQFLTRAAVLGLSLTTVGSFLAACGGSSGSTSSGASSSTSGGGAPLGSLTVRSTLEVGTLDPANWSSPVDVYTLDAISEGLVSYKPGTWDVVNTLAETLEPSSDGLSYKFTLKQGIPFHRDYGEVTAEDVKFSFERIAGIGKPKIAAAYQADWAALKEVKVESTYAGVIVMKEPFAPLMRSTLPVLSGKVMSKKAVTELGKGYVRNPVGTGPYEFKEWVPKQHLTLSKFEKYGGANSDYAPPPAATDIVFQLITDDGAAQTALQSGALDFSQISTAYVKLVSASSDFNLAKTASLNYEWIAMNVQDETLSNINLRKAIRQAIDVPGILEAAYDNVWPRARAIIPENMGLGYWADAPQYDRDVDKAKQYMQDAGVSSAKLTFTCVDASADKVAAQVVQQNLADIGIDVAINVQDAASFWNIPGTGGGGDKRQLVYSYYVTEPDPAWSMEWWTTDQIGLWNWCDWSNEQFDQLYQDGTKTLDTTERQDIYVEMQKIWDEDANMVWVGFLTNPYAYKKSVQAFFRPDGDPIFWRFTGA
jgi:peptide/nickel transport system substrate-binding protein